MGTYDVEIRDVHDHLMAVHRGVPARSAAQALVEAEMLIPPRRNAEDCVLTCYRRRRGRKPVRVAMLVIPGQGDDGGTAGVREPRRPLPDPGHLYAEADLPTGHREH